MQRDPTFIVCILLRFNLVRLRKGSIRVIEALSNDILNHLFILWTQSAMIPVSEA